MHNVLIRGLSDEAYDYYKKRASLFKRSVNAELKDVLERGVRRKVSSKDWVEMAREFRTKTAERWAREGIAPPTDTAADIIRKLRDS